MRKTHKLYNCIQDIIEKLREFSYILFLVIGFIVYIILLRYNESIFDFVNIDNIINLSGIFAGFIFTTFGIVMSLPDNKFTELMKSSGYMLIIYRTLLTGIVFFGLSMVFGLFTDITKLIVLFFFIGLSETILTIYYFYKLVTLTMKSQWL